jgi:hypothetical protein
MHSPSLVDQCSVRTRVVRTEKEGIGRGDDRVGCVAGGGGSASLSSYPPSR